ncbi:MAG: tRNA pseudouridine(38-40) synthase TruA [Rhodobacteraceae bacterium]|nr:tRNA pseudouridine(38-40) synthase TruA [Paracoccaceae bacterium]
MPRYALKIEYDGAPFCGWQKQPVLTTVQGVINKALQILEPKCEGIQGAGRTDAGVHATGQVGHVDLAKNIAPERLLEALNFHMRNQGVAIVSCALAEPDFHARFSAIERRYTFRLLSRRAPMTFDKGTMWQVKHRLSLAAMQEGASHLIGLHDFTTFRSTVCQALSPIKSLDELRIEQLEYRGGVETRFHIRARSFLHNQVRSFVGTLERVGGGSWAPSQVKAALEAKSRPACGPVCPPQGLYLSAVSYAVDPFNEK